jgi:shikimate dehydrogenase
MITYGLIGYPLTHSYSSRLFADKLSREGKSGYRYMNFPLASLNEFPALFRKYTALRGLNVTLPYKQEIIPWLEEIDEAAREIGAVNTIRITRERGNVHLRGFNTDAEGFLQSADFSGHKHALILGTGGASKAVAYGLRNLGMDALFVSRNPDAASAISYSDLSKDLIRERTLIVNATPLGMYPDVDTYPEIPYEHLSSRHFLYDLVYNPSLTAFLRKGSASGANVQNGMEMLKNQADLSYQLWNREM